MIVIMGATLFSTPGTYFGTDATIVAGPFTLCCQGSDTGLAGIDAFHATAGTIIFTLLTGHLDEAILAIGPAAGTGIEAIAIGLG